MARATRSILTWIAAMAMHSPAQSQRIVVVDSALSTHKRPDSSAVRQRATEELREAAKTEAIGDRPGPTTILFDSLLKMDPNGRESMDAALEFFLDADSFARALRISTRLLDLPGSPPLSRCQNLGQRGDSFQGLGLADSALVQYRQLKDLVDSLLGKDQTDEAVSFLRTSTLERLAHTAGLLGDTLGAISHARTYHDAMEDLAKSHPTPAENAAYLRLRGANFLAWILWRFQRVEESESLYLRIQQESKARVVRETGTSVLLPLFVEASVKLAQFQLPHRPGEAFRQTKDAWKVIEDYSRRTPATRLTQPYETELAVVSGYLEELHGMPEAALTYLRVGSEAHLRHNDIPRELVRSAVLEIGEVRKNQGDFTLALADSAELRAWSTGSGSNVDDLVTYHLQQAGILRLAGETAQAKVHSDSAEALLRNRGPIPGDDRSARLARADRIEATCLAGNIPRNELDSALSITDTRWKRAPSTFVRIETIQWESLHKFCQSFADSLAPCPQLPNGWHTRLEASDIGSWLDARSSLVRLLVLSGRADAAEKEALAALDTARRFQRLEAAQWIQLNLAHARYLQGKTAKAAALYRVFANKRSRPNAAFDWKTIAKDDLDRMRKRFPAIDWSKATSER